MTHAPPVPEGNQSPYPRHEAPHAEAGDGLPRGPVEYAEGIDLPISSTALIGVGAAVGLGALAVVGALLFSSRSKPKPSEPQRRAKPRTGKATSDPK